MFAYSPLFLRNRTLSISENYASAHPKHVLCSQTDLTHILDFMKLFINVCNSKQFCLIQPDFTCIQMKTQVKSGIFIYWKIFLKFIVVNFRGLSLLKYVTEFSIFIALLKLNMPPFHIDTIEKLGFFSWCCLLFSLQTIHMPGVFIQESIAASQGCVFSFDLVLSNCFPKQFCQLMIFALTVDECSFSSTISVALYHIILWPVFWVSKKCIMV